jgi:tetratricopeptide (TPR) repeat protein
MRQVLRAIVLAAGCAVAPSAIASGAAAVAGGASAQDLIAQANQLDNQGDHDGAIALYTKAIAAGDEYDARIDRSFSYAGEGRYADAMQDLDRAQALKPAATEPLSARYWFQFQLYQFGAVADTVAKLQSLRGNDPYAPLLRYIALSRLGRDAKPELAKTLTSANKNMWPQAAAQLFLGKVDPVSLLQWVQQSGNQQAVCEAPFYVGEFYLLQHDRDNARTAFQINQSDECRPVTEYYAARTELNTLDDVVQ